LKINWWRRGCWRIGGCRSLNPQAYRASGKGLTRHFRAVCWKSTPAGLVTPPGGRGKGGSLVHLLARRFEAPLLRGKTQKSRARLGILPMQVCCAEVSAVVRVVPVAGRIHWLTGCRPCPHADKRILLIVVLVLSGHLWNFFGGGLDRYHCFLKSNLVVQSFRWAGLWTGRAAAV
jgi:hypothetical protein